MEAPEKLATDCCHLLLAQNATLGLAESCTGGRLSAVFTALPGVSKIFLGAVVCYSNSVKENLLKVDHNALLSEGAVSEKVVKQMAKGASQVLGSHWSVAITGIAGPTGGSKEKPVGTVWFAIQGPDFAQTSHRLFLGNRSDVQLQSVQFALQQLYAALRK